MNNAFSQSGDVTDNLMTGDEWQFRIGEFPVDDMQVGAADRTGNDPDEHLTAACYRDGHFAQDERLSRPIEHHRIHCGILRWSADNQKQKRPVRGPVVTCAMGTGQPAAILAQPMVRRPAIFDEMYFRDGNTIN
jgi:hypothetical protein